MSKVLSIFSKIWICKEAVAALVLVVAIATELIRDPSEGNGWLFVIAAMAAVVLLPAMVIYVAEIIGFFIASIKKIYKLAFVLWIVYTCMEIVEIGIFLVALLNDGSMGLIGVTEVCAIIFIVVTLVNVIIAVMIGKLAFMKDKDSELSGKGIRIRG